MYACMDSLIDADVMTAGFTVLHLALNLVRALIVLIEPYMPSVTEKVCEQLNVPRASLYPIKEHWDLHALPAGHVINRALPLFARIEEETLAGFRRRFGGTIPSVHRAD